MTAATGMTAAQCLSYGMRPGLVTRSLTSVLPLKDSGPDQTTLLYFIPQLPQKKTWARHFENSDDPFSEQTTGPSLYDSHLY